MMRRNLLLEQRTSRTESEMTKNEDRVRPPGTWHLVPGTQAFRQYSGNVAFAEIYHFLLFELID